MNDEPGWSEELAALAAEGAWVPGDPASEDRRKVLEFFLEQGATVSQLADAARENRLHTFGADRAILLEGDVTSVELAEQIGLSIDDFERVLRTAGVHVPARDDPTFTEADVRAFTALIPALDLFSVDVALRMLRVIGSSLARVADAAVGAYMKVIERRVDAEGGTELLHAHANRDAFVALSGVMQVLDGLLIRHMALAIERSRAARRDIDDYDRLHLAVGFVDLVGYTSLSGRLEPAELEDLIIHFEDVAYESLSRNNGRVVKLIGDEVMYVTLDAEAAVDVALSLVAAFESNERTTPRGGVTVGELLIHDGDYYGPVVNLASRMADEAVPSEILVSESVRDELQKAGAPYELDGAGRRQLKGFPDPVPLWSVTRSGEPSRPA